MQTDFTVICNSNQLESLKTSMVSFVYYNYTWKPHNKIPNRLQTTISSKKDAVALYELLKLRGFFATKNWLE
jgi:hypothetical protein